MIVKANGTNQEGLSRLVIESETAIDRDGILGLDNQEKDAFYCQKPDGVYHLSVWWRDEGAPRLVSYLTYPWHNGPIVASCIMPGFYTVRLPPIPRPRAEWEAINI